MTEPHERVELETITPERSEAAFFIGRIGSREVVEVNVPYIIAPEGAVGIAASQIKKLANQTEGDEIIWIRTAEPAVSNNSEIPSEQEVEPTILANGRVVIDHESKLVSVDGDTQNLTPTEYKLLEFLAAKPGHVFSLEQIMDGVWGDHDYRERSIVSVQISSLRKKLGEDLKGLVANRRNFGYLLNTELNESQK